MDIKWFGTATMILSEGDHSLLFDPFVSMNPQVGVYSHEKAEKVDDVLITHGHFDHLVDVPDLIERYGQTVHCSETAAVTLMKKGVDSANINVIKPGDILELGPFTINVMEGKHIKFDLKLIRKTLFNRRVIKHRDNLKEIVSSNRDFPEGEVLVFKIDVNGKTIIALGSMNLAKKVNYPKGADLLILPFQGRSDINKYAIKFIKKLKPMSVYLHHFDDTFPPVSKEVNFKKFLKTMKRRFRKIDVLVPKYGESIEL